MSGRAGRLIVRRRALGEAVLERVVAALAARADLPLDRLADAQLAASALAAGAGRHAVGGHLCVDLDAGEGGVALAVGPLRPGAAERVVADSTVPGVGPVLERLVDGWTVQSDGGTGETLLLTIGPGGASAS